MDSRKVKGYTLGFIAASTYGLNPLFALPLLDGGMPPSSVLFLRYLLAVPIVACMMLVRGRSFGVDRRQLALLAAFGLTTGVSSLSLFESYRYMDAGIASTMLFVYPLMVALIGVFLFKEKLSGYIIFCLAGALAGIALLYRGEDGATLSLTGTVWVMVSSLTYAVYIVGVNHTALSRIPTLRVTFYVLLFGMLVFLSDILLRGGLVLPSDALGWSFVCELALFPTAVSFLCTTAAITYIGATPTAILGAMEPLTAVVIGVTVFGERLTWTDTAGLLLILVAVTMVILQGTVVHWLARVRYLFPRKHRR